MILACIFHTLQDTMREKGGLPVILSNCGTDFENPLVREYAIICLRNACEGNMENQAYVDSLKPQQILQDDVLASHGITVNLDPETGGIKFTQK